MTMRIPGIFCALLTLAHGLPVDSDIVLGRKNLPPLEDISSRLPFENHPVAISRYCREKGFEVEKYETDGRLNSIRCISGKTRLEFYDYDGSGIFEILREYGDNLVTAESKIRERENLISEKTRFRPDGGIAETLLDPGIKGQFSERNVYTGDSISSTHKDGDGDGLFETEFFFITDQAAFSRFGRLRLPPPAPGVSQVTMGGFLRHEGSSAEPDPSLTASVSGQLGGYLIADETTKFTESLLKKRKKSFSEGPTSRLSVASVLKSMQQPAGRIYLSGDTFTGPERIRIYYRLSDVTGRLYGAGILEIPAASYDSGNAGRALATEIKRQLGATPGEAGSIN